MSQAKPVFAQGILKRYLSDRRHSLRLGLPIEGNGRCPKRYGQAPLSQASNWLIGPWRRSLPGLLDAAGGGLLIDSLLGLNGSNLLNGDFSANLSVAYRLDNSGTVIGPIKDAMIAGNVYQLLGDQMVDLSSERQWQPGGTIPLPWALVRDVSVTARLIGRVA